jgi:hypothetical protein
VLFRKLFRIPICCSVFSTASWNYLKVSSFILRSLIHFELILVQGERQGFSCSLLHVDIQFFQQHLLETVFSPLCVLGSFVEDQLAINVQVYVWIFYSDPLLYLSVFVPV